MPSFPTPPNNNRIGFHYYPDLNHFRERDLRTWLPRLKALGATWLTILAPANRAVPELFLYGLIEEGIEPILHFRLPIQKNLEVKELDLLFDNYVKWGVHYVVLFNSPNHRRAWSSTAWAQKDLVERFLDRFIPLGEAAAKSGLVPVFPPLVPGGDYWDTAFLRASLQAIERRGNYYLLDRMAISANAFAGNRPLNWGSGGPERWPESQPYSSKHGGQDQRGFCIYDWYTAITRAVIGEARPILLFNLGSCSQNQKSSSIHQKAHVRRTLAMVQALSGPSFPPTDSLLRDTSMASIKPLPQEVLCGNFWLLTTEDNDPQKTQAWFSPGETVSPRVDALQKWISLSKICPSKRAKANTTNFMVSHPIPHYLVLPAFEWGITDWHLNAARPFIRKYRPLIGFSLNFASMAERVTVVGGTEQFPEEALDQLRAAGCLVERITGDGMSIATQLAEK
jgi:hypothetical protein